MHACNTEVGSIPEMPLLVDILLAGWLLISCLQGTLTDTGEMPSRIVVLA